jgi:hypothetical protein
LIVVVVVARALREVAFEVVEFSQDVLVFNASLLPKTAKDITCSVMGLFILAKI